MNSPTVDVSAGFLDRQDTALVDNIGPQTKGRSMYCNTVRCARVSSVFAAVLVVFAAYGWVIAGYALESSWDPDTRIFSYYVYVESGSPPLFLDFHVVNDVALGHYEVLEAPPGWDWCAQSFPSLPPTRSWLCFWGPGGVHHATFRIRYTGTLPISEECDWLVTDDGNMNPATGIIPGEGGHNAVGAVDRGVNVAAKVAVHVLPHNDLRTCVRDFPVITCPSADINTTCPAGDVDFFPVFFDLVEYTVVEYGISWPGTYSCAFQSCSPFTIGDIIWPPGVVDPELLQDGISQAWTECQPGPIAVPGFGWIDEPGAAYICVVPHPMTGWIGVADCVFDDGNVNHPVERFCAGINGAIGDDIHGPSATEGTSLGKIKAMFR